MDGKRIPSEQWNILVWLMLDKDFSPRPSPWLSRLKSATCPDMLDVPGAEKPP